ncbi:MAG: histidinol-phosphate phosphatase [Chloroflexi bacterium OLB15]|nr:MAG: histidinol-phosphate phosphatase [Chloroflexi bacterium OLB15]
MRSGSEKDVESLDLLLEAALDLTWKAGRITLGYFQSGVDVERKQDQSPVTIADKSSESFLRDSLTHLFPDHGLIGEEFGSYHQDARYCWVIDPIDGTKSFIHGVPLYACLLALIDRSAPPDKTTLVGVAHFPALNETVYAAQGCGCYWNGRRAKVSTVDTLSAAALMCSDFAHYDQHQPAFEALVARTGIQRTWGDAYGYALVATGRAEIMLDPKMNIWDCAPFGVIMAEAGGTFTDWAGLSTIAGGESVATNGVLRDQVFEIIKLAQPSP